MGWRVDPISSCDGCGGGVRPIINAQDPADLLCKLLVLYVLPPDVKPLSAKKPASLAAVELVHLGHEWVDPTLRQ